MVYCVGFRGKKVLFFYGLRKMSVTYEVKEDYYRSIYSVIPFLSKTKYVYVSGYESERYGKQWQGPFTLSDSTFR